MSEWKSFKLSELGQIIGGSTPSTRNSMNYEGGHISWITPKDLSNHSRRFIAQGARNITEQGLKNCSAQLIPKNSILFSSRAPIGYLAIAEKELCTNQGFKSIVPNDRTNYMFLYYLLKFNKEKIEYISSGTTFKEISGSVMKKFSVCVPPLETQKKIAAVLSALDDKIELNNAINKNLEEQAQAIYKSWFIDFEPFGGTMPDDWRQGRVEEIVVFHDSKRIPLSANERKKMKKIYPYYGATSIIDYVEDYIFNGIFLLFAEDGTVIDDKGFPILQYVEGKFWVNNHAHILTGQLGFSVETLYLLFKTMNINSIITGAVQQKVSQSNLKRVPVVIASYKDLIEFDKIISPMFEMIRGLRTENQKLGELRDALLPKLMSGEIDVSEVEI